VSDVAKANVQALRLGNGEMFNIATGAPTTDEEVFQAVREAMGIAAFTPRYVDKRPGEIDHCSLNVDKAARQLQWQAAVKLADGLRETVAYFQQRHAGAGAR
jgi:UDP-glucose 4-epimerase